MYVVKDDFHCFYLYRISVGASPFRTPLGWVAESKEAIHFSSVEEAKATINFIIDVVNGDLAGDLFVVRVPS